MLPMFYLGTDSRNFMEKWFPNRDPAKHLLSFLFHPRDHIWQQIVATYRTIKESADTFTVGLQLRNANKFEEWRCINYDNWPDSTHFFIASLFSGEHFFWQIMRFASISIQLGSSHRYLLKAKKVMTTTKLHMHYMTYGSYP